MDDLTAGLIIRAVRIRRGWRQSDVANAAGVSQTFVSQLERGGLERASLRSVRRVAASLGVRVLLDLRWRGADLAKLMDARHAALVETVCRRLSAAGWQVTTERTFSYYGERGSVDAVGWHAARRAFLLVEVKSELVDVQDLFAAFDRKRRLAGRIARDMGFDPLVMGAIIAFPEESTTRKAVERFKLLFANAYPARTLAIRRWVADPRRDLRGVWFLSISSRGAGKPRRGGSRRVRRPRTTTA